MKQLSRSEIKTFTFHLRFNFEGHIKVPAVSKEQAEQILKSDLADLYELKRKLNGTHEITEGGR